MTHATNVALGPIDGLGCASQQGCQVPGAKCILRVLAREFFTGRIPLVLSHIPPGLFSNLHLEITASSTLHFMLPTCLPAFVYS